jgi:hypothetical protein
MADSRRKDGLRTAPAITMPAYKQPPKGTTSLRGHTIAGQYLPDERQGCRRDLGRFDIFDGSYGAISDAFVVFLF